MPVICTLVILMSVSRQPANLVQPPRTPNVAAQRAAMAKLGFLIGSWSGEARIFRSGAEPLELAQTEQVQYKLDGLLLEVEGIGRTKDGKPALQALGITSYDDERQVYRFRAFNDGRWLESDAKLAEDGKGLSWSFTVGEFRTNSVLRMTPDGRWTEQHDIIIGSEPPRRLIEVNVSRTSASK